MGFNLKPDENAIYPAPFEEGKFYPLVITSQRVIQAFTDGRVVEIEGKNLKYLARGVNSTLLTIAVVLILIALPFGGCGLYKWNSVSNYPQAPMRKVVEKPTGYCVYGEDKACIHPSKQELAAYNEMKDNRVQAIVFVLLAAAAAGVAYLLLKKRLTVVCGGQKRRLVMPMKDKMQQTQVMMTLQAVQSAAKAAAAAQAGMPQPPPKA
jgi:hypothetical protein